MTQGKQWQQTVCSHQQFKDTFKRLLSWYTTAELWCPQYFPRYRSSVKNHKFTLYNIRRGKGAHLFVQPQEPQGRDDNGSAGHGSSGSTNLSGSRVRNRDPLTHKLIKLTRFQEQANERVTNNYQLLHPTDHISSGRLSVIVHREQYWVLIKRRFRFRFFQMTL